MIYQDHVTKNIRILFRESAISIRDFSEKSGIRESQLKAILKGASNLKQYDIVQIATAFDISPIVLNSFDLQLFYPPGKFDYTEIRILSQLLKAMHYQPIRKNLIQVFRELLDVHIIGMMDYYSNCGKNPP